MQTKAVTSRGNFCKGSKKQSQFSAQVSIQQTMALRDVSTAEYVLLNRESVDEGPLVQNDSAEMMVRGIKR
jgi:hypothetical protein